MHTKTRRSWLPGAADPAYLRPAALCCWQATMAYLTEQDEALQAEHVKWTAKASADAAAKDQDMQALRIEHQSCSARLRALTSGPDA